MYIGNDLQIAHPSYKIIDDISSGFNGSTTSFALQVNGATPVPFPISTQQVMISVNGVVQEPDPGGSAGFKLLGSNIVFSSAPANGHAFFGVINAGADYVTAGSEFPDGSATAPSFTFQDDQDTGWFRNGSGAVGYSANGVQTLTFDGNGLTVTGDASFVGDSAKNLLWDKSDGALEFAANAKAVFAGDLNISHDGDHGTIDNDDGNLYIKTQGALHLRVSDDEDAISITNNGAVELFHDNVKKFETTSNGAKLEGNLYMDDAKEIRLGDSGDFQLFHHNTSGEARIYNSNASGINVISNYFALSNQNNNESLLKATNGGAVELYHDNVKKFETTSSGSKVTGTLITDVLTIYDSTTPWITVGYQSGQDHRIQWDSSKLNIRADPNNDQNNSQIILNVDGSDKLILNKDGEIGIGGANYGSSGQVLTSGGTGSAASWTTISAAPQVTATVDGSLSANDAVILKTTGNVEKITETISINNPATFGGVRQEIGPENQTQSFVQVTSSAKKSVLTLYQEGNQSDRGRYYIWAYDGNGGWAFGNWGANKSYVSHGITFLDSCYYPGTNQIFIVSMPWNNNNRVAIGSGRFNDWTGSGGNDEGTDISWDSKTSALGTTNNRTNSGNNPARCAVDMGAGHFYTIFKDDNDDDIEVYYAAATTSGGVTIESTPSTPNGTTDCSNQVAVGAGNGLVLIAYQHDNGNSYLRAGKYDASATGKVTWGSAAEITNQTNTTTGAYFDISYNTGAGAFVFVWCDDSKPKCKAVTVNSSTLAITQGSNQQLDSNNCTYTSVGYDETTKSNPIAWRRNNNQDGFVRTATVSGTTITLTSSTSNAFETNNVNTGTPAQKFQIQDMKVYGVSIIGYRQNNQQFGEVRHLDAGSSSTNLTTENFLGFSSAAYSNGNTGTINVVGNTTTKSGLTPAQDYYVQRDGTIKTDPAEIVGSVFAGKALSSTKLLIKG